MESIPVYAKDLIEKLDELYPERSPDPKMGERHIWMYAGQRELIRNLLHKLKITEEEYIKE